MSLPHTKPLSSYPLNLSSPPQPWPEHPFHLIHTTHPSSHPSVPHAHFCRKNAQIMAQTHNTIFRALNAIHAQSALFTPPYHASPSLIRDFQRYIRVTCDFIHCHHAAEENVFFPQLETAAGIPGMMEGNVEQHRAFEEALARLEKMSEGGGNVEKFEGEQVRKVVEELQGPLERHLHDEIDSLVALGEVLDSETMERIYDAMHDEAARTSDKWTAGPFVFGNQDAEFLLDGRKILFPDVPAVVPYLIAQIVGKRHASLWRFNPSNAFGEPRPFTGRPLEDEGSSLGAMRTVALLLLVLVGLLIMAVRIGLL